jgi:alkylation response protein AidB-like acyl-CoA dehydrogenase
MDVFLRPEEIAVRQRVRDYFRNRHSFAPAGHSGPNGSLEARRLLQDMGFPGLAGADSAVPPGFVEQALIIEEVSCASPRLGQALLAFWNNKSQDPPGTGGSAALTAWSTGAATAIYEACLKAAREKGFFESALMDHQQVQMDLADLLSGLEAARIQTYRALHLIDQGKRERGEDELRRASSLAGRTHERAKTLAAALLGETWIKGKIANNERSRS